MPNAEGLSEKEIDYLREMINIGSGHAATALSQMLMCRIEVNIPKLYLTPAKKVPAILGDRGLPVACVKMGMVGDVRGEIFFVVPEKEKAQITRMAEKANAVPARKGAADISALEEIGNVMAGAYLRAIHDFCGLNIYHSVPLTATDAFQSLLDELLADMSRRAGTLVVIENEFAIVLESDVASAGRQIRALFIVFPYPESTMTMLESIKNAMPR